MRPNQDFLGRHLEWWSDVRCIGQLCGYTVRGEDRFKVPSPVELRRSYSKVGLDPSHLVERSDWTELGADIAAYLKYRATVLEEEVRGKLMNAQQAEALYEEWNAKLKPRLKPPMNKQKGEKRRPAYLTALVNMLVDEAIGGAPCDYDPRTLTSITIDGRPVRTLARRVDGAYPSATNPIALWEIKEYYYTTTFGSRIADGIYETLLDGLELAELKEHTGMHVHHYLIADSYQVWWEQGKSYLCRMIDLAQMGLVDEVIFGREVVDRIPALAPTWIPH